MPCSFSSIRYVGLANVARHYPRNSQKVFAHCDQADFFVFRKSPRNSYKFMEALTGINDATPQIMSETRIHRNYEGKNLGLPRFCLRALTLDLSSSIEMWEKLGLCWVSGILHSGSDIDGHRTLVKTCHKLFPHSSLELNFN